MYVTMYLIKFIKFYLYRFLQDMVKLLGPIEKVTWHLCGAKYPTLNLVYPYMELLKKGFASKNNEIVKTYINLIYGENFEYLPPVSTNGLLQKVQAAIYLSMDELWAVPTDIALVVTFLDLRFKHFNWSTEEKQNKA